MPDTKQTRSTVVEEIKQYLQDAGLTIDHEETDPAFPSLQAHYGKQIIIQISYAAKVQWVFLEAYFRTEVPEGKMRNVIVLLNHINSHLPFHHFCLDSSHMRVVLRAGLILPSPALNREQFQSYLQGLLEGVDVYGPLVYEQIMSNKDPDELFAGFIAVNMHPWNGNADGVEFKN